MFQINLHGDQLDKKTEEQLMEEMFKLAVAMAMAMAQNNLVQDRDESVRSYLWCFFRYEDLIMNKDTQLLAGLC